MNSMIQNIKNFINRITNTMPFFIKIVICSTSILYLLNLIIPYISLIFSDIPYYTIYHIQLWRLFTTPFMTTKILNIIVAFYFWITEAVKLEQQIGTIKYMLIFFMNTLCIQILYCFVMFLFSIIIQNSDFLKNKITSVGVVNEGLWPILLCDLTLLCLSNPDRNMKFFFIPFVLKAKYYPFFLLVIFTILSFRINLEILCGVGFAFLYHRYLKNFLKISNNIASKIGNSILFKWMKNQQGYIDLGGIGLPNLQNNLENVRNINISGNNDPQGRFSSFGGKGTALGGSGEKRNNTNNENNSSYNNESNDGNKSEIRLDVEPNNSKE